MLIATRSCQIRTLLCVCAALLLYAAAAFAQAFKPAPAPFPNGKYGGVLQAVTRENPPSLSLLDETTISVLWLTMPIFNNLVLYEPFRQAEDSEHLIGELAESWAWSDGGKQLTFMLRRGVKWHDGKPFTAADVKHTMELVRGVGEKKLRLNARKGLWENVKDTVTDGDYKVTLVLHRPQPGLLSILANGFAPVYPAHVDLADMRSKPIGTGPFRIKEFLPDQNLKLEKNPDYFIKGRPYLDGIQYTIIRERGSRMAALMAGQVVMSFPNDGTAAAYEQVKAAAPQIVVYKVASGVPENILVNHKKPPFDNPKLALALTLALDRTALMRTVHQNVGVLGGALLPPPYGAWGLEPPDLNTLPGWGDAAANKEKARKLLAEEGYGPGKPLQVTMSTRALENYTALAVWVIDQLRQVGIDGKLETIESATYFAKEMRGDFQVASNLDGTAVDDPDGTFLDRFRCTSTRNYTRYCNPEVDALIEKQSMELDRTKRLQMVREVDRRLQRESARPALIHRVDHFMHWPFVKNLVPHHNIYSYGRMQEVWLDK